MTMFPHRKPYRSKCCYAGHLIRMLAGIVLLTATATSLAQTPTHAASERIESLILRMSLEEKAGQLTVPIYPGAGAVTIDPETGIAGISNQELAQKIRDGQISSIYAGVGVVTGRALQRIAVEESRLGIPMMFTDNVIHGVRTMFPIPLGETSSFEPDLAYRTARATAVEATALGVLWNFAPSLDLSRDQRWGRVVDGPGEDPVLGSAFAAARIRGSHGDDLRAHDSMIATAKHFVAYGEAAAGLDYGFVDISPQTLRDVHLPPFKAAVDAGAVVIMSAFNDVNGVPTTANHWLLTEILRDEWGFEGVVISDYTTDMELIDHGYAADEIDAAHKSMMAGLDMTMVGDFYPKYLPDLVRSGKVPEARVDEAVRRVLRMKEMIGLFDDPYRSLNLARENDTAYIPVHDALARDSGRRSIVLLKNEGNVLPLGKQGQRIALIGPFVQDTANIAGPSSSGHMDTSRFITLEAGVRAAIRDQRALEVVPGSGMEAPLDGGIEAAVAAARRADVVVLAVGEPQNFSGEAQSRVEINLPPAQQALAEAVAAVGKPVVVLLRNGRALALHGAVRDAEAIAVTWFLGTQNGHAIADVLFGDYNPSGKLPVSFPQHSGQQPYFYNQPRSGRPQQGDASFRYRWREILHAPLYPFGHGLSYTTFAYDAPQLNTRQLSPDGELVITTRVTNSGQVTGEEVVQLYIHDRVASRVRPVQELKRFTKISLQPGQSHTVTFRLTAQDLAFTGVDGTFAAEPGLFDLWVAPSSGVGEPVQFELQSPF